MQMSKTVTCGPIKFIFTKTFFFRRKQQNSQLQQLDKQRHQDIS